MSNYMADSHRDWHTIAAAEGTPAGLCPFDCGAGEIFEDEVESLVLCGFCKCYEPIWMVRLCAARHYAPAPPEWGRCAR